MAANCATNLASTSQLCALTMSLLYHFPTTPDLHGLPKAKLVRPPLDRFSETIALDCVFILNLLAALSGSRVVCTLT